MYLILLFENLTLRYVYGGASLAAPFIVIVYLPSSTAISNTGFRKFMVLPPVVYSRMSHALNIAGTGH
jgi:hypothetical protein